MTLPADLRVVMVTDFPRNIDAPHGGVEAVSRALAIGFAGQVGLDLHILTSQSEVTRTYSRVLSSRLTVHYLPRLPRLELASLFIWDRAHLGRLLRDLKPDVVHAHDLGRYPYVCQALGYSYALTIHGLMSVEERVATPRSLRSAMRAKLLRWVEARAFDGAAVVLANSRYMASQVPTEKKNRTVLIPNPVDPLFLNRDIENSQPVHGRIIWVGRLIRLKAVELLVQALVGVRRVVPSAHLRLVGPPGDPSYRGEIGRLIERLGLIGAVEFAGTQHATALRAEYAAAQVFALPSLQENAPVSIAEAMAVGRPVVATRVGGVAEMVIDGDTGVLCEAGNVADLERALISVLRDPERGEEMGAAGHRVAAMNFSPDQVTAQHWRTYTWLAELTPHARRLWRDANSL